MKFRQNFTMELRKKNYDGTRWHEICNSDIYALMKTNWT